MVGPFPVKLQVLSAVLVGVDSIVGVSQVLYLLCELLVLLGIALSRWFIILSTLFISTYMEGTLSGEHSSRVVFDKCLVLYQLFIKHQLYVGNLQSFPSQMTNLLTQCFLLIYKEI